MARRKSKADRGANRETQGDAPEAEALARAGQDVLTRERRREIEKVAALIHKWFDDWEGGRRAVTRAVLTTVFRGNARRMADADRLRTIDYDYLVELVRERVSLEALSQLLRVFAYDHLVRGAAWSKLGFDQKHRLLPLADRGDAASADSLRRVAAAAAHVAKHELKKDAITAYVQAQLLAAGRLVGRKARLGTFDHQAERSLYFFEHEAGLKRLLEEADRQPGARVDETKAKLERAARAMLAAARKLEGRGRRPGGRG